MKLPQVLKFLRVECGYTQARLSNVIRTDQSVISDWENGIKTPHLENLIRLADWFGISLEQLAGRAEISSGDLIKIKNHINLQERQRQNDRE